MSVVLIFILFFSLREFSEGLINGILMSNTSFFHPVELGVLENLFLTVGQTLHSWSTAFSHAEMKSMLCTHGPMVGMITITNEIEFYLTNKGLVYSGMGKVKKAIHGITGLPCSEHAMLLTGWGDCYDSDINTIPSYWLAQNKWGIKFGLGGYFRIWMEMTVDLICLKSVNLATVAVEEEGLLELDNDLEVAIAGEKHLNLSEWSFYLPTYSNIRFILLTP